MNIYFMIDELNRDAVVASALKKIFLKKGHNLVYGNRASNKLLKYFHEAFDVIIFPRPHLIYDNWGDDWLTWSAKFVTLSTESLGIICKDHQVMAKTLLDREYFEGKRQYVDRIDAFCFWGEKQLQAVKDYAPEVVYKCHVVGHPRHDDLCVEKPKENWDEPQKDIKSVGVIARAVALNDYFKRSPMDWFTTLFDDHVGYEFHNKITGEKLPSKRAAVSPANMLVVQAIDVENTLKIIKNLLEAGHKVSLRMHPKEDGLVWRNVLRSCRLNVEISDPTLPITDWLQSHDYIFGPPSTSFYDAAMVGVTPISICSLDSRRKASVGELWEENNRLMDHVFKPESIEDLLKLIDTGTRNTSSIEILGILREEANFPDCANALNRFVDLCLANPARVRLSRLRLLPFKIARAFYFSVWRMRNFFLGRRENSAMFSMTGSKIRFIDGLSSGN